MNKNTKFTIVQWLTIGLVILYLLWEFIILTSWKENTKGPLLRIDLIVIYPLILIGIVVSLRQFFKK
ncbi:hypothetical protein MHL31_02890 [Lutibacter sp. A80]|uniref:hypothetical protein n=1 Tax=Lutibacter sp. A80 TaxID=2918453 RepID=UPI001F05C59E|nr:hypothetical protein [Lutibacter sp. A80]UMB61159.1 hypothetical protein MHL31_02890 [Lutibacter sp. A80]